MRGKNSNIVCFLSITRNQPNTAVIVDFTKLFFQYHSISKLCSTKHRGFYFQELSLIVNEVILPENL